MAQKEGKWTVLDVLVLLNPGALVCVVLGILVLAVLNVIGWPRDLLGDLAGRRGRS